MKFKRKYFFGGDHKDSAMDDYITEYTREDGKVKIVVQHSFSSWNKVWYDVEMNGEYVDTFNTLKEAKSFAEKL